MKFFSSIFLILFSLFSYSQNIGIGTSTPHASAALEIKDSTKGILIPRMTMVQRNAIANPAEGLMVYQTDGHKGYWYFDGAEWKQIESKLNSNIGNGNSITVQSDTISGFMKFIGDGREGNFNSGGFTGYLSGEHFYSNFIIPSGSTLNLAKNQTTIIHVSDTCIIEGLIDGAGRTATPYYSENLQNRIGAVSGWSLSFNQCSQQSSFSWNETPDGIGSKYGYQNKQINKNGHNNSITNYDLLVASYFALNIHGLNSCDFSNCSGRTNEGGSGLIIICKKIIFNGQINLMGGNSGLYNNPCGSAYPINLGAGGGGSCIISWEDNIQFNGTINTHSGDNTYNGGIGAGNGGVFFVDR
jgi:hypothetical protein